MCLTATLEPLRQRSLNSLQDLYWAERLLRCVVVAPRTHIMLANLRGPDLQSYLMGFSSVCDIGVDVERPRSLSDDAFSEIIITSVVGEPFCAAKKVEQSCLTPSVDDYSTFIVKLTCSPLKNGIRMGGEADPLQAQHHSDCYGELLL